MPNVGSGLGAQFGVAKETTYGTYVPPGRFVEVSKVDLHKVKNTSQSDGVAAGRPAQLASRRKLVTQAVEGSIDMEVTDTMMGIFFEALCGGTPTVVQQGGSAAYLQTHTIAADSAGKSLTLQTGVPRTTAATDAFSYLGCKIVKAEFKCSLNGNLTVTFDVDGRKLDDAQTLGTASYSATVQPFDWGQSAIKIHNTYGSEVAVDGVREFSLTIERHVADDRFYIGNLGLKSEPITNDWLEVSGSFNADYLDKAIFADRFHADTGFSIVWEFVGPLIAATYYKTLRFKLPKNFLDGDTPGIDGPDLINGDFDFVTLSDGTNPLGVIEYMSTDTAV